MSLPAPRPAASALPTIGLIVLGSAAMAVPDFATTTSLSVATGGITQGASLAALIVLSLLATSVPRGSSEKRIRGASILLSLSLIAFEVGCLLVRDSWLAWNYLSVSPAMALVERLLRVAVAACLMGVLIRPRPSEGPIAAPAMVVVPLLLCLCAGVGWYVFSWFAPAPLTTSSLPALGTLGASLLGWIITAVYAFFSFLITWKGSVGRLGGWPLLVAFLGGALYANAALRLVGTNLMPNSEKVFFLVVLAVVAVSLLLGGTLIWLKSHGAWGSEGSQMPTGSLNATPGERFPQVVIDRMQNSGLLSRREREVVLLELEGKTRQEIARALCISRSTVATHLGRAYEKLGVSSRQELLSKLLDEVQIDPEKKPHALPLTIPGTSRLGGLLVPLCAVALALLCGLLVSEPVLAAMLTIAGELALMWGVWLAVWSKDERKLSLDVLLQEILEGTLVAGGLCVVLAWPGVELGLVGVLCLLAGWSSSYVSPCSGSSYRYPALIAAGATGLSLVSLVSGQVSSSLLMVAPALIACLVLLACVVRINVRQSRIEVADVILEGSDRTRAYLMGRGLSELEASIALLTALGFDSVSIAGRLDVSTSTVSSCRSCGYKKLEVEHRSGLSALLRREAGME